VIPVLNCGFVPGKQKVVSMIFESPTGVLGSSCDVMICDNLITCQFSKKEHQGVHTTCVCVVQVDLKPYNILYST
jgi:hypothetical protein